MSNPLTTAEILAEMLPWLRAEIADKDIEIGPETEVIAENLLDSMDLLRLVSYLEERFGLALAPELIVPENFTTPQRVAELIARVSQGA